MWCACHESPYGANFQSLVAAGVELRRTARPSARSMAAALKKVVELQISTLNACQCDPPSAEALPSRQEMDELWRWLRSRVIKHGTEYDSILRTLRINEEEFASASPRQAEEAIHAESGSATSDDGDDDDGDDGDDDEAEPIEWIDGLGDDLLCLVLRQAGVASTGAAAATCSTLRDVARRDEIWLAHAESLEIDTAEATAQRTCKALCRDLVSRRRLEAWVKLVDARSSDANRALVKISQRFEDAMRRLSKLQMADYRVSARILNPPAELELAARLLRPLFCTMDAELSVPSEEAVAWLQNFVPQIHGLRGEQAQEQVADFLSCFHQFRPDRLDRERIAAVEEQLGGVCLKRLDETIEKRVREGYEGSGGGGSGPSDALRASRVASAIVRWAVSMVQNIITKRRERQLNAVASEILRCRANTPPVRLRLS